jgi:tight adherence protein C
MGSPIGEALNILSDEIRTRRFLRGEELALQAPIKLLFPLLFFILPVVLIIVGGPVILQFLGSGGIKF